MHTHIQIKNVSNRIKIRIKINKYILFKINYATKPNNDNDNNKNNSKTQKQTTIVFKSIIYYVY